MILIFLGLAIPKLRSRSPFLIVGIVIVLGVVPISISNRANTGWRDAFVGESGFNDRNFNVTLSNYPKLIEGRRLIRLKAPVSGSVELPDGNSLVFMLVDGTAEVGGVKLSRCRRMGSLLTAEGPYLMDAQACRLDGSARLLIGTANGAAAFAVRNGKGEAIIFLDVAFLSQKAPDANAKWLLKEIKK